MMRVHLCVYFDRFDGYFCPLVSRSLRDRTCAYLYINKKPRRIHNKCIHKCVYFRYLYIMHADTTISNSETYNVWLGWENQSRFTVCICMTINMRFAFVIDADLSPLSNDGRTNCENLLPVPVAAHRLDHLRCGRHSAGHCHARGHVHRSRCVQDDFLRHFPVVGGEDHTGHQSVHDHSDLDSADCRRGEGNVDMRQYLFFDQYNNSIWIQLKTAQSLLDDAVGGAGHHPGCWSAGVRHLHGGRVLYRWIGRSGCAVADFRTHLGWWV